MDIVEIVREDLEDPTVGPHTLLVDLDPEHMMAIIESIDPDGGICDDLAEDMTLGELQKIIDQYEPRTFARDMADMNRLLVSLE